ncbi:uncharacterized protein LOC117127685 [Brassica rapa]|uniref:uncharacterized protein LOC117127685 n=1 Tax=Brassica campestris TaxID=3711 RepID=UPI00142E75DA|nr:uncharacterized protein LOC117127685 [Brassica rapa]
MKFVVDLEKRHCTCNVFDIDKIPCIHAIAAAKHIKRDENRFVDASHLTETWAKAYAESIHPGGELSTSTYPENIDELSCPPPATKNKSGRPPTKRKRSDKVSMEGSSKKMMKRPIEEVYGCDAAEGFKKGKKETVEHYRALLRFPTNTGYLRMIGILHPAKQIQLLSKSSCLKILSKLMENLI